MSSYQPIANPPGIVDVKNPIMDLLIKDEKLQAASENAFEAMQHMSRRLTSLEESDPAYEALAEAMGGPGLYEAAEQERGRAIAEIETINQAKIMDKFEWLLAIGGTTYGTGGAVLMGAVASTGAGAAVAAGGLAVSTAAIATIKASGERETANQLIDDYLKVAEQIEKARENFDATWARLIEEEGPET